MISTLYTTVTGTQQLQPSAATLQEFFVSLTALPDNMLFVLFMHYHNDKSKADIAALAGVSEVLVERWMQHGVCILQLRLGIAGQ
jgi:DNA-directed RNA polymerase specialized sigma24 family protein